MVTMLSFVPLAYNSGEIVTATPVGPLLSASMLACCIAVLLGTLTCYYGHVQPMHELMNGRQYNAVYPEFPATALGDAAFLSFANQTRIDSSKVVSMKSLNDGLSTFCVAPVFNQAETGRIQFWAVGVDCCSDSGSGSFSCDDASDRQASNAWVLREPSDALYSWIGKYIAPPVGRRDMFLEAVHQAEHRYSLAGSEEPILVRWTKMTKMDLIQSEIRIVMVAISLIVLGAALMAMFLTMLNMWYTVLWHQQHKKRFGRSRININASFLEFFEILNKEREELESHVESSRPRLSKWDSCFLGVVIPFFTFFVCVLVASYGGCVNHGGVGTGFVSAFIVTMVLSLLLTQNRVINGLCIMLCALGGLHIGFINYESNMFQYCSIEKGQTYSNVMPDSNSKEYADVGKIEFAASAHLSQSLSAGYLYQDVTYCVAPILSSRPPCLSASGQKDAIMNNSVINGSADASTSLVENSLPNVLLRASRMHYWKHTNGKEDLIPVPADISKRRLITSARDEGRHRRPTMSTLQRTVGTDSTTCADRVEFWAMGINCCDGRGNFDCDGAKDQTAKSAIVVHPFGSYLPHLCRWISLPTSICDSLDTDRDGSLAGSRRQLLNAVDKSVAATKLAKPENIVFLRWGKNADDLQGVYKARSFVTVALSSVLALVIILSISAIEYSCVFANRKAEDRWLKEQDDIESLQPASQMSLFASIDSGRSQTDSGRSQVRV